MTDKEYNDYSEKLKEYRDELVTIRTKLELAKKDSVKYNIIREVLNAHRKKIAKVKYAMKEYEMTGKVTKK